MTPDSLDAKSTGARRRDSPSAACVWMLRAGRRREGTREGVVVKACARARSLDESNQMAAKYCCLSTVVHRAACAKGAGVMLPQCH